MNLDWRIILMKYNDKHRIKFTSISEKYDVPKNIKGNQCMVHACVIDYVMNHYRDTKKYKEMVVEALNLLTFMLLNNQVPSVDWKSDSPLATLPEYDPQEVVDTLGDLLLTVDGIEWDVKPVSADIPSPSYSKSAEIRYSSNVRPAINLNNNDEDKVEVKQITNKEDLYIKSPTYPQFNYNKPWLSIQDGSDRLAIYTTLPEVPTKQNQISITTNVDKLTDNELMKLYPASLVKTRAAIMYEPVPGIKFDSDLGVVFPIEGFSESEIVDNIIRYPHLYKLKRKVGDEIRSFYDDIELDGQLYPIEDIWDRLPESSVIPRNSEYIKEYVTRRYILERDKGMMHNYPMYGTLDPFLTVFMPPQKYIERGYTDTLFIMRSCVLSRVSFKQSRNPIMRRLGLNA